MNWIAAVEALPKLHRCARHPARVAILVFLHRVQKPVSFPVIREKFGFSDGNLNRHLKVLVDDGWVRAKKEGAGRGSKTTIELADGSRAGLRELRDWIQRVDLLLSSEPVSNQNGALDQEPGLVDDRSRGWVE
ncbi:MAG: hypothetical protein DRP71_06860 [Verrucomicrobia bacterium]|nr:MAG: hypothetical protein DRP71_06860 [Verrucomicrobiota bacterium]